MSQISHINATHIGQSPEPAQTQAAARPNFRNPAALLARLSGVGKFTSPFKPSLVGRDSYLARLADQFARRPLGDTPAGRLASDMLALTDSLANRPITKADLARLDALRAKAEQPGMPADARDFCNSLARTVMLRPLTDALVGIRSKETRTQLAESLHGVLDHLFSAKNDVEFLQTGFELTGQQETFRMLGILGDEQESMFKHLEDILSFRQNISEGLDELDADMANIARGEMPGRTIDKCLDSANALCHSLHFDADAPAMARMDIGPMNAKAQRLVTSLSLSIAEKAADFASRMNDLATAIRAPEADLTALGKAVSTLKDDLSQKTDLLPSDHFSILQSMGSSLDCALHASGLLREAHTLMAKNDVIPAELQAKTDQIKEALVMPGLDIEDAARLNSGMEELTEKLTQISKAHLDKLMAIMDGKDSEIKNAADASDVQLDTKAWTEEAETFLLPDDKTTFEVRLSDLITYQADTMYATIAAQLTGEPFDSLSDVHLATLKELCLGAGCHPSLVKMFKALDSDALKGLLRSFQNILDSNAAHNTPQNDDIRAVDAHFLRYPELDDVASALLRKDGPDYRFDSVRMLRDLKAHMEKSFSSSLLKNLNLPGTDTSDISFLSQVVACAAKARLVDKAQLQQIDFSLIQALWYCHKASNAELTFETFKGTLPEPYKTMPLLQKYMDAGISGRRALKSLSNSLALSSQGMGTRWALMGFLTEAQAQNIKWSAGLGLKGLYRELELNEYAPLEGRFKDVLKGEEAAGGKDAVAEVYAGTVDSLRNKQEGFEEKARTLSDDKVRCEMAERLGMNAKSVDSITKGSSLAACVLLLDHIFNDPSIDLVDQHALVMSMSTQTHFKLDKGMVGSDLLMISDNTGKRFRNLMDTMRNGIPSSEDLGGETFQTAREQMLALLNDLKLAERAEAVFYFKKFEDGKSIDAVKNKLWSVVDNASKFQWNNDDPLYDIYGKVERSILGRLQEHGIVAGAGHQQNVDIQEANKDAAYVDKEATKILKNVGEDIESSRQERITKIVSLAICEQIARSSEFNTLEDLRNAIDQNKAAPQNWDFYNSIHTRLLSMGVPKGTTDLFLHKVLASADHDFFVKLAKSGQKGMKTQDTIASLVDAQMTELKEEGKTLTLSRTTTGTISLTAGAVGVADIGVSIEMARQNGLTVWKDKDNTYHMTVMDGVKAGVSAEIAVEFKKLIKAVTLEAGAKAGAGVDGNFAHGCDLSFANAAHCQMFLYAILSRQTSSELLALCKDASLVHEGGISARVSLSANAQVSVDEEEALFAAELGAGAEGSIQWRKAENGDHTQRSRTLRSSVALKAEASLNLGVLETNVNNFADSLKGKITDKAEGVIDSIAPESLANTVKDKGGAIVDEKSGVALDAFSRAMDEIKKKGEDGVLTVGGNRVFAYEETRTITEKKARTSDGKRVLESYESVRAFAPENKAEAIDLLRQYKVSVECMLGILDHVKDMPASEGFRLELVSTMKGSAIAAYNADPTTKISKDNMVLTEVRVITQEEYQKERGLERGPVNVSVARGFTRTQTASFVPNPATPELAKISATDPTV